MSTFQINLLIRSTGPEALLSARSGRKKRNLLLARGHKYVICILAYFLIWRKGYIEQFHQY